MCASLVELALPAILRVLFLVYPIVANAAFEAFPCYTFADASFLKADVSIECSSAEYTDRVVPLAWAAIGIYPIGLLLLLQFSLELLGLLAGAIQLGLRGLAPRGRLLARGLDLLDLLLNFFQI